MTQRDISLVALVAIGVVVFLIAAIGAGTFFKGLVAILGAVLVLALVTYFIDKRRG